MTINDKDTGHPIYYVVRGQSYKVDIKGFDDGAVVSLFIVLSSGLELPLGVVAPFQGPTQSWEWVVGKLLHSGQHVAIKAVQLDRPEKQGYTPQVVVRSTETPVDNLQSFLDSVIIQQASSPGSSSSGSSSIHPSVPAGLRHLLKKMHPEPEEGG